MQPTHRRGDVASLARVLGNVPPVEVDQLAESDDVEAVRLGEAQGLDRPPHHGRDLGGPETIPRQLGAVVGPLAVLELQGADQRRAEGRQLVPHGLLRPGQVGGAGGVEAVELRRQRSEPDRRVGGGPGEPVCARPAQCRLDLAVEPVAERGGLRAAGEHEGAVEAALGEEEQVTGATTHRFGG